MNSMRNHTIVPHRCLIATDGHRGGRCGTSVTHGGWLFSLSPSQKWSTFKYHMVPTPSVSMRHAPVDFVGPNVMRSIDWSIPGPAYRVDGWPMWSLSTSTKSNGLCGVRPIFRITPPTPIAFGNCSRNLSQTEAPRQFSPSRVGPKSPTQASLRLSWMANSSSAFRVPDTTFPMATWPRFTMRWDTSGMTLSSQRGRP